MIKMSDADLIEVAIKVTQCAVILDTMPEDTIEEAFDTAYSYMMNACVMFLEMVVAKYKQDNSESELDPDAILHILSCSSCRTGLTHSNKTRH